VGSSETAPARATEQIKGRVELVERLARRAPEIEEAVMTRMRSLAEMPARGGPEYLQGLRAAVGAGIGYGIEGICTEPPAVPEELLSQARRAARVGVGLDTVLRRYVAGHSLLGDFLVQEAGGKVPPAELKRLLRRLAAPLDRLLAAVTDAYREEEHQRQHSAERRRSELAERLLAGEPLDVSELDYELEGWHLALVARGSGEALGILARVLDARLLAVERREEGLTWGWLGRRTPLDAGEALGLARGAQGPELALAIGEPGEGISGWRLSHRQAMAALPVALRRDEVAVRYAEVALPATVLMEDLLATSLRKLYLEPLAAERDGGATLRETLRAYFAAGQNVSSAAAALRVNRATVAKRLQLTEDLIERPISACGAELSLALWLVAMDERRG